MNYNEKLQLIDQLALRLKWLMQALTKAGYYHQMRDRVPFIHIGISRGALELHDESFVRDQQAASIVSLLEPHYNKDRLLQLSLEYNYASDCLTLGIIDLPNGGYREMYGAALDAVLDYVDEIRIREAFAQHEARFFRETNTTPQHWRIDS